LTPVPARAGAREVVPYQVDWTVDLAVIGGASALWLFPTLIRQEVIRPSCPCKSSDVPAIDHYPIGRSSTLADQLSNVAEAGVTVVPLVLDAIDAGGAGGGWRGFAGDTVVLAEVLAVNGALNQLVKMVVRRPRPKVYDVDPSSPELTDPGNYLAFYSGHASTAFAAGMAYATTFALRHPDSPSYKLVYGAAGLVGGTVALLRVLAGQHFPTDVMAGAAIGSALGLVIPRLHRRSLQLTPTPGGLAVTGRF
jgi:membrane-associated phospholipid phosphatase